MAQTNQKQPPMACWRQLLPLQQQLLVLSKRCSHYSMSLKAANAAAKAKLAPDPQLGGDQRPLTFICSHAALIVKYGQQQLQSLLPAQHRAQLAQPVSQFE